MLDALTQAARNHSLPEVEQQALGEETAAPKVADPVLALERNRERLVIDMVRTSTYVEATPFVE